MISRKIWAIEKILKIPHCPFFNYSVGLILRLEELATLIGHGVKMHCAVTALTLGTMKKIKIIGLYHILFDDVFFYLLNGSNHVVKMVKSSYSKVCFYSGCQNMLPILRAHFNHYNFALSVIIETKSRTKGNNFFLKICRWHCT